MRCRNEVSSSEEVLKSVRDPPEVMEDFDYLITSLDRVPNDIPNDVVERISVSWRLSHIYRCF